MKSNKTAGIVAALFVVVVIAAIGWFTRGWQSEFIVRQIANEQRTIITAEREPLQEARFAPYYWTINLNPPAAPGSGDFIEIEYACNGCAVGSQGWNDYQPADFSINFERTLLTIVPLGDRQPLVQIPADSRNLAVPHSYIHRVKYEYSDTEGALPSLLGPGATLWITGGLIVIWVIVALGFGAATYYFVNSQRRKRRDRQW